MSDKKEKRGIHNATFNDKEATDIEFRVKKLSELLECTRYEDLVNALYVFEIKSISDMSFKEAYEISKRATEQFKASDSATTFLDMKFLRRELDRVGSSAIDEIREQMNETPAEDLSSAKSVSKPKMQR